MRFMEADKIMREREREKKSKKDINEEIEYISIYELLLTK